MINLSPTRKTSLAPNAEGGGDVAMGGEEEEENMHPLRRTQATGMTSR
jgi:hypothetical protein